MTANKTAIGSFEVIELAANKTAIGSFEVIELDPAWHAVSVPNIELAQKDPNFFTATIDRGSASEVSDCGTGIVAASTNVMLLVGCRPSLASLFEDTEREQEALSGRVCDTRIQ